MGALISSYFKIPLLGTPISDLEEGTIVKINENGTPVDFYIAKHDYESDLNGAGRTLLVRKDCYDLRAWNTNNVNAYATSTIDAWLNGEYEELFALDVREAMGTTSFYSAKGNGNSNIEPLERTIFLLSMTELGKTYSKGYVEGTVLPIAELIQSMQYNGNTVMQWVRTPSNSTTYYVCCIDTNGSPNRFNAKTETIGYRPCFTLPFDMKVNNKVNSDGSYSLL